jgi:hypothetical protein
MRHLLRVHPRVLPRTPALRYGVLGWLLLSLILTLPSALDRWAPQAHAEQSLTAYAAVPNLQWRLLLLIALATGVAIASLSRPGSRAIISAFVAVICVVWGSWLVYWAVVQLAPTLWPPPPDTALPPQSHSFTADLYILLLVSFIVVPLGALVGAVGSMLGYGLQWVARGGRQLVSSGSPQRSRNRPIPVSAAVSAGADQDRSNRV